MKQICIFLIFFVGGFIQHSQAYEKMIETGNRWNYISYPPTIASDQYEGPFRMTYSYRVSNDTTIGQMNYKNLMCDAITHENTRTYYAGALREDTVSQQVFFKLPCGSEQLAYAFNHAIGDTLRIDSLGESDIIIRYVNDIDTINVGDKRVRRFEICEAYYYKDLGTEPYFVFNDYWVEGIGSFKQLPDNILSPYRFTEASQSTIPYELALLCFWNNDDQLYHNPAYDSCVYTSPYSSVNRNIRNHEGIMLYPNPAVDQLHLACDEPVACFDVLAMDGRVLWTATSNEVDVSSLPAGIYFIRALTESGKTLKTSFIKRVQ